MIEATQSKKAPINMRVLPEQKALISKAADLLNMDRTTFILNVVCREAEEVLLNQRFFHLNDTDFQAFEQALTAPIPSPEKLQQLLSERPVWHSDIDAENGQTQQTV